MLPPSIPSERAGHRLPDWAQAIGLGVAVFIFAALCLAIPREFDRAAPMWLPNGVVLAALLMRRGRDALKLGAGWAGNVCANLAMGDTGGLAVMLALNNSLEIALAVVILRSRIKREIDLSRRRDLAFFILAALAAPVAAATFLSTQLHVFGYNLPVDLSVWAVSDALGLIVVTPALLALVQARDDLASKPFTRSGGASLALLFATSALVFGLSNAPLLFVLFLPSLWVVFDLERFGAAIASILTAVVGIGATLAGRGPVALHGTGTESIILLQTFLAVLTLSSLSIASVLMERRRLQEALNRAHLTIQAAQDEALRRQRLARETAEAAAMRKANFLADMTHELRTPLTSILGFIRIAMEAGPLMVNQHLERVNDAADDLLRTVNDLLDFSKLEAGQLALHPEKTQVCALGRRVIELLEPQAAEKDLTLHLECEADGLTLFIDPHRTRQILINYMSNAIRYTDRGEVTLRLIYSREASELRAEVIDTGRGLPPDQLPGIFDRYAQAQASGEASGAGLGLAICRQLAEVMGGRVGVSSTVGAGSIFWVTVAGDPVSAPSGEGTVGETEMPPTGRLLIADDHSANRDIVKHLVAPIGLEVVEAEDGGKAVELALSEPFDLILMDMRMPRLDGRDAMSLIRRRKGPNQRTPILAFSADATPGLEAELRAQGFSGWVEKPIDPRRMLQAFSAALRAQTQDR